MGQRTIAAVVAIAFAAGFSLGANAQTKSVKVQSTWPASITLQDHLRILADRIDKLTQGSVKIEVLAAGQIVPPFEVLDATNKKVLDGFKVRTKPEEWLPGKFVHPHDACYDKDGNIFVVEWVATGRVTLLRRVG